MSEQIKYLVNRIGQLTASYEAQVIQLIAVIEERDRELAALRKPPEDSNADE